MPAESAFQQVLETGLLGAFLVISFMVIVYLYRELTKERSERLADLKEVWKGDLVFREQIKQTLENITSLLRGK
jgi:hypothetical protein